MAGFEIRFRSKVLSRPVKAYACIPADGLGGKVPEGGYKTLVLLHGMSGGYEDWPRNSQMEMLAEENGIAVLCPDGMNSHYSDWEFGIQFQTFLQTEFLPFMRKTLPLSTRREDTFVGGLSMGGYGATKWAFTYPETFSHVISFSGGLDIEPRLKFYTEGPGAQFSPNAAKEMELVFGDLTEALHGKHNIYDLARQCAQSEYGLPRLYVCSGEQDIAMEQQMKLAEVYRELGGDVTESYSPGYHDFHYWAPQLEVVMTQWLPLEEERSRISKLIAGMRL